MELKGATWCIGVTAANGIPKCKQMFATAVLQSSCNELLEKGCYDIVYYKYLNFISMIG